VPDINYSEDIYDDYIEEKATSKNPLLNIPKTTILIIFGALILIVYLTTVSGGGTWKQYGIYGGLAVIAILLIAFNKSGGGEYMSQVEAETLAFVELTNKRRMENLYGIGLSPDAKIEMSSGWLHPSPWDGSPFRWEIGVKITNPVEVPRYYSAYVDPLKSGVGMVGFKRRQTEYQGEDFIVVQKEVPIGEMRHWQRYRTSKGQPWV